MERFYADDIIVFETHERARAARSACIAHEREAIAQTKEPASLRVKAFAANAQDGDLHRVADSKSPSSAGATAAFEERFYYEGMVDEGDEEEVEGTGPEGA